MNTDNHNSNRDEAEAFGGRFSKAGANNPFRAEHDYFENFAAKISSRVDEYEELKSIAPVLSNIPKYNPFSVPAGYFDELPASVQQRVTAEKQPGLSIIEWLQLAIRPRFVFPVLTVVFIAFTGIRYMNRDAVQPVKLPYTAETSIDEQLQLQNIDEATIVDALASQGSAQSVTDENQHIVDYLVENNVDESNL